MRRTAPSAQLLLGLCVLHLGGCGKEVIPEGPGDTIPEPANRIVLPSSEELSPVVDHDLEFVWDVERSPVAADIRDWESANVEVLRGSAPDGGVVWLRIKRMPKAQRLRLLDKLEEEVFDSISSRNEDARRAEIEKLTEEFGIGAFDRLIFINSRGDSPLPVFQEYRSTSGFGELKGSGFTLPGPSKTGDDAAAEERYGHLFSIEPNPDQ